MSDVIGLVMGKGLRLTALGIAIGLAGAFVVVRLLASVSPEMISKDPFTFLLMAAVILTVASVACWLPARRAARVDPMIALRGD